MSPVRLLPDAERLAVDYLRGHADVAALVGTRVAAALPTDPVWPYVTAARIGGVPSLAGYLDNARLEFSAWGPTLEESPSGKALAEAVARTVEAAMWVAPGTHPLGVVTRTVEVGDGLRWNPDDYGRPRYQVVFDVNIHPPAAP